MRITLGPKLGLKVSQVCASFIPGDLDLLVRKFAPICILKYHAHSARRTIIEAFDSNLIKDDPIRLT